MCAVAGHGGAVAVEVVARANHLQRRRSPNPAARFRGFAFRGLIDHQQHDGDQCAGGQRGGVEPPVRQVGGEGSAAVGAFEAHRPVPGSEPRDRAPLGRITLPVTFGSREAFRTEHLVFDVAHAPLPYNGILGRPALIKFMAATHCAYDVMKMPSVYGVLSIRMMAQSHGACNSNKSTCASYT